MQIGPSQVNQMQLLNLTINCFIQVFVTPLPIFVFDSTGLFNTLLKWLILILNLTFVWFTEGYEILISPSLRQKIITDFFIGKIIIIYTSSTNRCSWSLRHGTQGITVCGVNFFSCRLVFSFFFKCKSTYS